MSGIIGIIIGLIIGILIGFTLSLFLVSVETDRNLDDKEQIEYLKRYKEQKHE